MHMKSQILRMVTMAHMVITDISITQINIYITHTPKKMIKTVTSLALILLVASCALSPGMHMQTEKSWINDGEYVYIEAIDRKIKILDISSQKGDSKIYEYKIGVGDQLAITVWGLPEIFPLSNINPDQNLRRVDSNGNIFFPYAGLILAEGKSQNELRIDIANSLSKYFKNPQLDLSIVRFNSQRVYLLGEVSNPSKINISDVPLSLSEALGQTKGINNNTAEGSEVFVIRQAKDGKLPSIYRADLSSPAGFLVAGNFYLTDNDVVYVNAKGTARWNRVVSQFFPFSSLLNSVNNLSDSN